MADYTVKDIDQILAALSTDDAVWSKLGINMSEFNYSGFEPMQFLVLVVNKGKAAGRGRVDIGHDMLALALLGCIRGNNLSKIRAHATDALKQWLTIKSQHYGLVSTADTNSSVTLSRLALVMANVLSKGYHNSEITVFPGGIRDQRLPAGLNLPVMAGLLPYLVTEAHNLILADAYQLYQFKFDRQINANKARATPADYTVAKRKVEVARYFKTQFDSNFYSDEQRTNHALAISLIQKKDDGYELVPGVIGGLTAMQTEWNALA